MAAFKYKFRVITDYKDSQKNKAETELAEINTEINKLIEARHELTLKLNKISENKLKRLTAHDLNFESNCKNIIQSEINSLSDNIAALVHKKELKRLELIDKNKEHKVLQKLEEKHYELFKKENLKLEINDIDETASLRFVRVKK